MSRLLSWFRSDRSVLRGAVVLGSGAAVGQLFLVASTPIISRLYTPEDIGQFALYLAFINVAITIAPLGYQRAIPTARTKDEAAYLAGGVILIQPAMACLLALAQFFMIRSDVLGFGVLPGYASPMTGLLIVANTLLFTLRFWFIRSESFPVISRVPIFQNVGRSLGQIGLGVAGFGLFGLLMGDFVGRLLGLSGMLRAAWSDLLRTVRPFRVDAFWTVFVKFRKFLFPQLPSIVVNTVGRMLPVPLLVHYFGAEAAGLYAMVDRVMQVPVAFVSKSFGDALHGRIGRHSRENPGMIMPVFLKSSAGLFLIGIVPVVVVVLWGEVIFAFVLGDQWLQAGQMASRLAPLALATLVVSTTSRVVYIFQAFYTEFIYNVVALVCVLGTFIYGDHRGWDVVTTVGCYAILAVVAYILYYLLLVVIVRRGVRECIRSADSASTRPGVAAEPPDQS